MGWFDEQIRERLHADEDLLDDAYLNLSSILLGKKVFASALDDDVKQTDDAINAVLGYFSFKKPDIPKELTSFEERIAFALRSSGMMSRNVTLRDDWYTSAIGPMIGVRKCGQIVALIPGKTGSYSYFCDQKKIKVTVKNVKDIEETAISFYKPLPNRKLTGKDLYLFMFSNIRVVDVLKIIATTIAIVLMGFVTPYATNIIFDYAIASSDQTLLFHIFALLMGSTVTVLCITIMKNLLVEQAVVKIGTATEAALVMRLISLPSSFFRNYNVGELSNRVTSVTTLSQISVRILFTVGFSAVFSILYLFQVFTFAPSLVLPSLAIILFHVLCIFLLTKAQIKRIDKRLTENSKLEGMTNALFSGVEKLKLAGAERRLFAIWLKRYRVVADVTYNPPFIVKIASGIPLLITTAGSIVLYAVAIQNNLSVANFMAFTCAFGLIVATLAALMPAMEQIATIPPTLQLLKPILEETPEIQGNKQRIDFLSGSIELEKVTFRYGEGLPAVIDNLSVTLKRGDYVAIVGNTGCGKSTLLRLLLGFENPEKGAIYYDKKDMTTLDIQSLRKKIGVVLQDSRLISGSVYDNIAISSKNMSEEEVWLALEDAGMADEVRAMPMKLQTYLSDGSGGISGGQKQRLMIARAIASKPKILIFDEATSALDNITQKKISEALDKMKSTRIIIAHRLSTIKQCNRILVLDQGQMVADGSYDKLLKENAFFKELVKRQSL